VDIFTIIAVALSGLTAFFFFNRQSRAEKQVKYLQQAEGRRARVEVRKEAIRDEVIAAEAEVAAAKQESVKAAVVEREKIYSDAKRSGAAKAAMEHLRRVKKLPVIILLVAFGGSSARAEPCVDGYTVRAGEALPCDAECLPEDALTELTLRSAKLTTCESDTESTMTAHKRIVAALREDAAVSDQARIEADAACVIALQPSGTSLGTVFIISVASLVVGAVGGALIYHGLRK